jgi:hypothetical protein
MRLPRNFQVFLCQLDAEVRAEHAQNDIRVTAPRVLARYLPGEARRLDAPPSVLRHK